MSDHLFGVSINSKHNESNQQLLDIASSTLKGTLTKYILCYIRAYSAQHHSDKIHNLTITNTIPKQSNLRPLMSPLSQHLLTFKRSNCPGLDISHMFFNKSELSSSLRHKR